MAVEDDILAAIQAQTVVLQSIDARLATAVTQLTAINGNVNGFQQVLLHLLAVSSRKAHMPKPPWWDSVVSSYGLSLKWGGDGTLPFHAT